MCVSLLRFGDKFLHLKIAGLAEDNIHQYGPFEDQNDLKMKASLPHSYHSQSTLSRSSKFRAGTIFFSTNFLCDWKSYMLLFHFPFKRLIQSRFMCLPCCIFNHVNIIRRTTFKILFQIHNLNKNLWSLFTAKNSRIFYDHFRLTDTKQQIFVHKLLSPDTTTWYICPIYYSVHEQNICFIWATVADFHQTMADEEDFRKYKDNGEIFLQHNPK